MQAQNHFVLCVCGTFVHFALCFAAFNANLSESYPFLSCAQTPVKLACSLFAQCLTQNTELDFCKDTKMPKPVLQELCFQESFFERR